jgi:CBS domain-containing protein
MRQHKVGAIPVVESQTHRRVVGIITDRDICVRRIADGAAASTSVARAMTPNPITCRSDDTLAVCESLMQTHAIRRLPVINDAGICIGMVAQADVVLHDNPQNVQRMLREISRPDWQADTHRTILSA